MAVGHRKPQSARMRRRYTREQRAQLLDLVAKGTMVAEAATRLGVGESSAYNWVAESREEAKSRPARRGTTPTFVRLVPSAAAASSIVVRIGSAEIEIRRGYDGELLQAVVATLTEGAQ